MASRRLVNPVDSLAVGGVLGFMAILVVLTWGTWGDLAADTGYDLLAGSRLANGELPYRDYVYYYGPLAPALLALFYKVGGVTVGSAVALGLVLATCAILATYALARLLLLTPLGAFMAAAITASVVLGPRSFNFVQPHTYSAPLGFCAVLGFLIGVTRYAFTAGRGWLAVAGVCAGLVTLTRPELAAGILAAEVAWLALRARAGIGNLREAVIVAAPTLLIPASVYGAFVMVVSPYRLMFENLYPVDTLKAAGNVILKGNAPLTLASFVELSWKAVLYFIGIAVMLSLAKALARPGVLRRSTILAAVAFSGVALVISVQRPETVRYGLKFAYGWIPLGIVLAILVLLWRLRYRHSPWSPSAQVEFAGSIVLAAIALKTYAIFFMYSHVPQIAAYAVPLVSIFLARLHLAHLARSASAYVVGMLWLAFLAAAGAGLTWKDAAAESERVIGPAGGMYVRPNEAVVYQQAISSILARTEPKEAVLIGPQLTSLYVLTDRRNPLPQLSLLPGALPTVADEHAAISRLEASAIRLAIIDRQDFSIYGHSSFGVSFQRVLASWVREKFDHVTTLGEGQSESPKLDVWLRRVP